jgi:hypothetical protein
MDLPTNSVRSMQNPISDVIANKGDFIMYWWLECELYFYNIWKCSITYFVWKSCWGPKTFVEYCKTSISPCSLGYYVIDWGWPEKILVGRFVVLCAPVLCKFNFSTCNFARSTNLGLVLVTSSRNSILDFWDFISIVT